MLFITFKSRKLMFYDIDNNRNRFKNTIFLFLLFDHINDHSYIKRMQDIEVCIIITNACVDLIVDHQEYFIYYADVVCKFRFYHDNYDTIMRYILKHNPSYIELIKNREHCKQFL